MLTLWNPRAHLSPWHSGFAYPEAAESYRPAVDVEENEASFTIRADLPGIDEKDLEITVHEGVLTLSGKREDTREEERANLRERRFGAFSRRFRLGNQVSAEGIEASYKNGVLTITMPKKEEVKPRQISVSVH